MKNFNLGMYMEIFEWNQYERYMVVERGDLVLDLGCSMGYFYFKNSELGIDYIGVDGSVDHLKDFIDNLNGGGDDVNLFDFGAIFDGDFCCSKVSEATCVLRERGEEGGGVKIPFSFSSDLLLTCDVVVLNVF